MCRRSGNEKSPTFVEAFEDGAGTRNRTRDLLIKRTLLTVCESIGYGCSWYVLGNREARKHAFSDRVGTRSHRPITLSTSLVRSSSLATWE